MKLLSRFARKQWIRLTEKEEQELSKNGNKKFYCYENACNKRNIKLSVTWIK